MPRHQSAPPKQIYTWEIVPGDPVTTPVFLYGMSQTDGFEAERGQSVFSRVEKLIESPSFEPGGATYNALIIAATGPFQDALLMEAVQVWPESLNILRSISEELRDRRSPRLSPDVLKHKHGDLFATLLYIQCCREINGGYGSISVGVKDLDAIFRLHSKDSISKILRDIVFQIPCPMCSHTAAVKASLNKKKFMPGSRLTCKNCGHMEEQDGRNALVCKCRNCTIARKQWIDDMHTQGPQVLNDFVDRLLSKTIEAEEKNGESFGRYGPNMPELDVNELGYYAVLLHQGWDHQRAMRQVFAGRDNAYMVRNFTSSVILNLARHGVLEPKAPQVLDPHLQREFLTNRIVDWIGGPQRRLGEKYELSGWQELMKILSESQDVEQLLSISKIATLRFCNIPLPVRWPLTNVQSKLDEVRHKASTWLAANPRPVDADNEWLRFSINWPLFPEWPEDTGDLADVVVSEEQVRVSKAVQLLESKGYVVLHPYELARRRAYAGY